MAQCRGKMWWQLRRRRGRAEALGIIIGINAILSGTLNANCDMLIEMLDMLIVIGKAEGATVHTGTAPRL